MTLDELLAELSIRGVQLRRTGADLTIRRKAEGLDAALVSELRAHKAGLLEMIEADGDWWSPPVVITPAMLTLVDLTQAEIDRIVATVPGGAGNVQDIYPLAPLQEGILFHHLMASQGDPYVSATVFHFADREKLDAYLRALQAVIDRHDILRTAVLWDGLPRPVQVVWRVATLPEEEVELGDGVDDPGQELYRRYHPRQYRLDVRQAPMMKALLTRDGEGGWYVLLLTHHLIGDHTTLEVMYEEIEAHMLGRGGTLPAPAPFRNLVAHALLGVSEAEHEAFFREMLLDVDEPTAPYGLLQIQDDGVGIGEARLEVGADLAKALRARARALGVSAATLCHVAWAQVLARLSGRDDVVFGTVLFGRMHGGEGADRAMGLFINTLPLRVRVDVSVEQCAKTTHALLAELLRHEHASLALAQRCSSVAAPAPLFSALLNYRHSGRPAASMAGESAGAWEGIRQLHGEERSNYPLAMAVDDFGEEFSLRCQAEQPVDPMRVCLYLQAALEGIADALAADAATPVGSIDVLPSPERAQIVEAWNATAAPFSERFLHEQFEEQAARTPDAVAVADEQRVLRYAELNARANQLAHELRARGVGPDDRVAVCVGRSVDMLVSLLAVWKAGGAYVPLDPAYPLDRTAFMLEDARPVALVADARAAARGITARATGIPVIDVGGTAFAGRPETNPDPRGGGLRAGHLAYVIYTSGSSGRPKGAGVEHRGLQNLLHWYARECAMTERDVVLVATSYSFDLTQKNLFGPLLTGGKVVLAPEPFDPRTILPLLSDQRVSMMNLTPSAFHALIDADAGGLLSRLRLVVLGGEPIQPARLLRLRAPRPMFMNGYGPTECTAVVAYHRLLPELDRYGTSVPIGRPIPNARLYILDAQRRPVPLGVPGDIYVGGVPVGRGYLDRPQLSEEAFVRDPFVVDPSARMYKTGDRGRFRSDGAIEFLGRNDGQVKSRGFRIELGEIEARLAEHPGIREATVAALDDEAGGKRLVAYYVLREHAEISDDALRAHLAAHLPEYMVPVAYVPIDALPLTPSGKLDRRALASLEHRADRRAGDDPQTGVERAVAAIWADLLKIQHVGRHDDFFALGGHSLMAIQVISRIREALGVDVELTVLFESSALADFAAAIPASPAATLPPVTPAPENERHALSFAQQRLWFLARFDGVSEAYHMPFGVRLVGELDRHALLRALDRLVERHESLRTTFRLIDGEPRQVIAAAEESRFALVEHDLTGRAEGELEEIAALEAREPFDFERGPLIRGRLVRLAADDHTLLVTQHHIISDGWSIGILLDELSALYAAFCAGEDDPLPPLPIQYADYAAWQRRWVTGEVWQKQAEFWRETLSGAPALLSLPTDRPRPSEQDYAGAAFEFSLDADLTRALRALSQRNGTTLFMTMLASWAAVLSRLSAEHDIVIGTPAANRGRAEIERLIGFFVNTLALRFDFSDDPSVAALLERTKALTVAAQQHQDIPFEQVVEIVRPVRSLSHSPVVQVVFNWRSGGDTELTLAGLTPLPGTGTADVTAKFDLVLSLGELGDELAGGIEYATALFDRTTMERYLGHWRTLLEGMVADESQAISRLPLLTPETRAALIRQSTAATTPRIAPELLHEWFEKQAETQPDAVAILDGSRSIRYGEVNAEANRMGRYLRTLGVGAEHRVAIHLERGAEMVIAVLAILKAGGVYVPIDPGYPGDRAAFMLADSLPDVVITQSSLRHAAAAAGIARVEIAADERPWTTYSSANLERAAGLTPASLAYIIYTSGSTGRPKGVMVEHANVARLFTATDEWFRFGPSDVWTLFHSLAFDFSVWEIFGALLFGGRLLVVDHDTARAPELFYELLCREGVTVLNQTPSAFRQLMSAEAASASRHVLRHVVFGGEALETAMLAPWFDRNDAARTTLINMYGITETTVHVTYRPVSPVDAQRGRSPIGQPIPDLRLYLLDRHLEPVPHGVTGELYVGGAGVARGYLNRPDLTAARFIADPFVPDARLYKTGDLARRLPEGELEFIGRNDTQVKIRGFRIELGEIEARIGEYPGVREVAVILREDAGDKRLVAYYAAANDAVNAGDLRAHAAQRLPGYMVPAAFVRLDAMPLTRSGKLDRAALPAPAGEAFGNRPYEAPEGDVEIAIAAIWTELLRLERVGRHDNFFESGGHSLLAVTLMERLRRTGFGIDVRTVFSSPTVAGMAAAAAQQPARADEIPTNRIPVGAEEITPEMLPLVELTEQEIAVAVATVAGGAANVQDIYPLAPLQEGILFHHVAASDGDPYVLSRILRFEDRVHLDAFVAALQAVVARHDILRTGVVWKDLSTPVQVVWRTAILPVETVTIDAGGGDAAEQLYQRVNPRRYRLDVARAPMMHLYIARDPHTDDWLLLLLRHHLVNDHSTMEVMETEVDAFLHGRGDTLPPPLPFRNYIARTRQGVTRKEHEAFFREMLGDVESATAPFGLIEVQLDGSGIREGHLEIGEELARRLRERARVLGVSAASLFHFAWAAVLARVSGSDDIVFGTVLFGRMQNSEAMEQAMGLYINTLPFRVRIGEESIAESIRRTHASLGQLLRHEHASLALAQRCSGVPAGTPLFSSLLNYRHNALSMPRDTDEAPADAAERAYVEERTNYPLLMSVDDLGLTFGLSAQVQTPVDPTLVCELLRTALEQIVELTEKTPSLPAQAIDVLPAVERARILDEVGGAKLAVPPLCLHELFEAQAERMPASVAVVHDGRSWTYRELNEYANRLAHHLRARGVRPDERVAISVERGPEMIASVLAVLKAGGAYVPVDPAYPADRTAYMLGDSRPVAVIAQPAVIAGWKNGGCEVSSSAVVIDLSHSEAWAAEPATNPARHTVALEPGHLAYVLYTSGSTGKPKGVMLEHRNAVNFVSWSLAEFPPDLTARTLFATSLNFDLSIFELFVPLASGGAVHVVRDAVDFARDRSDVTLMNLVPSALMALLDADAVPASVRCINLAGEPLLKPVVDRTFAGTATKFICNLYGPTETTTYSTWVRMTGAKGFEAHVGRPVANTRVYVLDAHGRLAPRGVVGEIFIGGDGVARGYFDRPQLTAERFVRDPFDASSRMYKTGDLGRYLHDGNIEYLGRNDFQVKVRGFRIELGEIETRLGEQPGVRRAAVIVREDQPGDPRLVAYVVPDGSVDHDSLRRGLAAALPAYMIPSAFVSLEQLPLTPNGKLDRRALPAPPVAGATSDPGDEPRGPIEELIAGVWAVVLKRDRIGRDDNFFELGGHSLQTLPVTNLLRQGGVEISVADLYKHPTVSSLAAEVRHGRQARDRAAVPMRTNGSQRPLFIVHEISGSIIYAHTLTNCIDVEVPVYALPAVPASDPQLRTMREMGERMVGMMRAVAPAGPYRIAGWSFGALLAYEIASQLLAAGERIEFLALIDQGYSEETHALDLLEDEREFLLALLASEATEDQQATIESIGQRAGSFEEVLEQCAAAGITSARIAGLTANEARAVLARDRDIVAAGVRYVAAPIGADVHIFAAREGKFDAEWLGWDAVQTTERLRIHRIAGTHHTILEPPHIDVLGRAISDELRACALDRSVEEERAATRVAGIPAGAEAITPDMLPHVALDEAELARIVATVPGGAANVQDIYPLTPLQEGMLFHHLLSHRGDPYLMPSLTAFASRAQLDAYLAAFQQVVDRHDILRTAVLWEGLPAPVQVVYRRALLHVEEVALDPAAGDVAAQLYARFDPRRYRLDVQAAPMIHLFVAHDPAEQRWLSWMLRHHLVHDHSTLELIENEIRMHAIGAGADVAPAIAFRDFVLQPAREVTLEQHQAFFSEMLRDVDEPTLPFGLADVHGDGSGVAEAYLQIGDDLTARVRDSARRLGITPASVFHVAWAQVLARVSGRDDVVFGTLLFGRTHGGAGAEQVFGMLINTLPVRITIGDESVEGTVRRAHRLLAELLRHEHAPLALAQRCSGVRPPAPLFSALFNYRYGRAAMADDRESDVDTSGIDPLYGEERTSYPLVVSVDDVINLAFILKAQVRGPVDPMSVCRLLETALDGLVTALESAPHMPAIDVDVFPVATHAPEVRESEPRSRTLHALFEEQAAIRPSATAVVCNGRPLSYAALDERANAIAHRLRGQGVRSGDRVAIVLERSADLVAAQLAVLKAGAAYVPLEPSWPAGRIARIVAQADARVVIARADVADCGVPQVAPDGEPALDITPVGVVPEVDSDAPACVFFTSGSTGQPKGVVVPHRAIAALATRNGAVTIESADRVAFCASPAFDAATFEVWGALLNGASVVVVPRSTLLDPARLAALVRAEGVTVLQLIAGLFDAHADAAGEMFESLRYLITGGDVANPRAIAAALEHPAEHLVQTYGPTETTVFATACEIDSAPAGRVPIGRPIAGARIELRDGRDRVVPAGAVGEICISGDGVTLGYWNDPELTARKFVLDPLRGGARMYRTGDLGRWLPDGNLEFCGRVDEQLKVRGVRVEPAEIEARLLEHEQVRAAVVVPIESRAAERSLAAYVVTAGGAALATAELRSHVAAALPLHMVPSSFIAVESLPLTEHGKIDRAALPRPEGIASGAFEPPAGALEATVTSIWEGVLGRDRIGRNDDLWTLGAHSLLAMRVTSRFRAAGFAVALDDVLQNPTVATLASSLSNRVSGDRQRALLIRAGGDAPPLFVVHDGSGSLEYARRLAAHVDASAPVYGLPPLQGGARTIETIAARMLPWILAVQPSGPYRLCGWSFGGLVVYEIAAQLLGRDEEVELLALLDTRYVPERQRSEVSAGDDPLAVAAAHYQAQPISTPIRLFIACETESQLAPHCGWEEVVSPATIHTTCIEGSHRAVVEEPALTTIGTALSQAMRVGRRLLVPEAAYSPWVVLRGGQAGATPLICIPGAGANVVSFAELTGAVDPAWPMYGLQPRGLDGQLAPHSSVAAAAKSYLNALTDAVPDGPVHLLGHSFGGWVVFELAHLLRAAGRRVASTTLIDTERPTAHWVDADDVAAMLHLVEIFEQAADASLDISAADLARRDFAERLALLHRRLVEVGILRKRSSPDVLRGPFRVFASCLRTAYVPAAPSPDLVRLVVLRNARLDAAANRREQESCIAGWKEVVPELEVWHGPGNHMTAFTAPHVQELGRWLCGRLRESR